MIKKKDCILIVSIFILCAFYWANDTKKNEHQRPDYEVSEPLSDFQKKTRERQLIRYHRKNYPQLGEVSDQEIINRYWKYRKELLKEEKLEVR